MNILRVVTDVFSLQFQQETVFVVFINCFHSKNTYRTGWTSDINWNDTSKSNFKSIFFPIFKTKFTFYRFTSFPEKNCSILFTCNYFWALLSFLSLTSFDLDAREHWTEEVSLTNEYLFFLFLIGRWYYEKNILSL